MVRTALSASPFCLGVCGWRIDRRTFLFYCSISCTCYTSCISEDSIASAAPIAPCHSSTIANILCSFGMLRDRKQVACDLWDMKIVLDDDCISRC
ncbi:hypothetical protein [Phaffia rhodozyma]|uniref:Uncharacterized protein n=1 Tax=Phaffia rhodozyma TaxID=264483 RepID=A0A0F7SXV8_PHARH|nr:hypothetical protein [Phaffia rhodozyma]